MAKSNLRMPSSGAGITQFYNESKSKISVSPQVILGIAVLVIIVTIILNSL